MNNKNDYYAMMSNFFKCGPRGGGSENSDNLIATIMSFQARAIYSDKGGGG